MDRSRFMVAQLFFWWRQRGVSRTENREACTGLLAGGLYMRPPRVAVATAVQRCARSDWAAERCAWADRLAWLSVQDKMNFARLHGTAFHLVAVEVRRIGLDTASCSQSLLAADASYMLSSKAPGLSV